MAENITSEQCYNVGYETCEENGWYNLPNNPGYTQPPDPTVNLNQTLSSTQIFLSRMRGIS